MSLDLLDNVLLLHFAFEAAKGVFEGLTLLKSDFRQPDTPPNPSHLDCIVMSRFEQQVKQDNWSSLTRNIDFASDIFYKLAGTLGKSIVSIG